MTIERNLYCTWLENGRRKARARKKLKARFDDLSLVDRIRRRLVGFLGLGNTLT